jgi:hypothetical protein
MVAQSSPLIAHDVIRLLVWPFVVLVVPVFGFGLVLGFVSSFLVFTTIGSSSLHCIVTWVTDRAVVTKIPQLYGNKQILVDGPFRFQERSRRHLSLLKFWISIQNMILP